MQVREFRSWNTIAPLERTQSRNHAKEKAKDAQKTGMPAPLRKREETRGDVNVSNRHHCVVKSRDVKCMSDARSPV